MKALKTLGLAAVFASSTGCALMGGGQHLTSTPNVADNTVTLKMGESSSVVVDFTNKNSRVIADGQVISNTPFAQESRNARIYREYAEDQLADAKAAQAKAKPQAAALTAGK